MEKQNIDIDSKWEENVAIAKQAISGRNTQQMKIAELALEVCEISYGGGHMVGKYTLKRFAEEVGMKTKTLSNWVAIKRMVYDKLSPENRINASYTRAAHVSSRVSPKATSAHVNKVYQELNEANPMETKMIRYLYDFRSAAYNFETKNAAGVLSKKVLQEYLFYCQVIERAVHRKYKNIRAKNNNISHLASFKTVSAASACLVSGKRNSESRVAIQWVDSKSGGRIAISPKDRDIVNYLKKKAGKFVSPTELGVKIKGHSKSSATAWAGRTIAKLLELELIERNKFGHYAWKKE